MGEIVSFPTQRARNLPEPFVTKRDVAAYLRVTPRWIELRMRDDGFPYHKDQKSRLVRYRISEIDGWLASRRAG